MRTSSRAGLAGTVLSELAVIGPLSLNSVDSTVRLGLGCFLSSLLPGAHRQLKHPSTAETAETAEH
eukprot:scaffold18946_cov57-Cyclotella_meneghiniana.AAC.1